MFQKEQNFGINNLLIKNWCFKKARFCTCDGGWCSAPKNDLISCFISKSCKSLNLIILNLCLHVDDGHLVGFDLVDCHGSLLQLGGQPAYVPRLKK